MNYLIRNKNNVLQWPRSFLNLSCKEHAHRCNGLHGIINIMLNTRGLNSGAAKFITLELTIHLHFAIIKSCNSLKMLEIGTNLYAPLTPV